MKSQETVGVIGGKGKMGRFFAHFFREHGYDILVSDVKSKHSNIEVARQSDIVLVSVPIDATLPVIEEIGPYVKKGSLLMDLTSIKGPAMKKMLTCSESSVLGCHPMFAPTNRIESQVCIFCRGRGREWELKMTRLFEKAGAIVRFLDADKHDEFMTVIQGLMHFIDITTTKTLAALGIPVDEYFEFRSPSYRLKLDLMGRTLFQDSGLYRSIQMENPKTSKVLRNFLRNASTLAGIVEKKDVRKFDAYWNTSKEYLGNYAQICQEESDDVINFLSASKGASKKSLWREEKKRGKIGILGPENTFSHLAAKRFFPKEESLVFYRTIPEVFEAFDDRRVESILVPVENKIEGSIGQTLDGLFQTPELIQALFRLPIHYVLAGLPGTTPSLIRTISSHSQPLNQCSKFIQRSFPDVDLLPSTSTAHAITEMLRKGDRHSAIICSEKAAENAGLSVISRDLANSDGNETRFAFLSHSLTRFSPKKSFPISSIVFYFDQDSPGTLASVLTEFSRRSINLTKIESRPAGHIFGEYIFFLDFEGTLLNETTQEVLGNMKDKGAHVKILGSYPVILEL